MNKVMNTHHNTTYNFCTHLYRLQDRFSSLLFSSHRVELSARELYNGYERDRDWDRDWDRDRERKRKKGEENGTEKYEFSVS